MRRPVAVTAAAGVIAAVALVAVPSTAAATVRRADGPQRSLAADPPPTHGASRVLAGGGLGWNGPASSAALPSDIRTDAAAGGALLVASPERGEVLRVDPVTDRMVVVPGTGPDTPRLNALDVAAAGGDVVVAAREGLVRVRADGSRATLSTLPGIQRVDVGADGVVWAATPTQVVRVLTDGSVLATTPATAFTSIRDLVVTPDGARAYVIDAGTDRYGVYAVTPAGVGARVVGNGQPASGTIDAARPATSISTGHVTTLATDGSTLWLGSRDRDRVVAVSVASGVLSEASPAPAWTIDRLGSGFALGGPTVRWTWEVVRYAADGTRTGRLAGVDPDRPWTPDGAPAVGSMLGSVVGAAALPGGLVVLTTQLGQVREVRPDGTLRTRANLGSVRGLAKVALAADGTAFVLVDGDADHDTLYRVPATGVASVVLTGTGLTDVEVAADGALLVADGPGRRLLRRSPDGTTSTLVALDDAPTDLALDGSGGGVLVAGAGLRRLAADGTLTTLMTGGDVVSVAPGAGGIQVRLRGSTVANVLRENRSLAPVRADDGASAQAQAVADGSGVAHAGGDAVRLVTDPGLAPERAPVAVSATPGPGRVVLDWDGTEVVQAVVRAKKGSAPVDQWDGEGVDDPHTVLRVGGPTPLAAGEEWWFSVFFFQTDPGGDGWSPYSTSAPVSVRSAALVDDISPPGPFSPRTWRTRTDTGVQWNDPWGDDFLRSEARFLPGTTPPMTLEEGEPLTDAHAVPGAVAGTDYAVSIFTIDLHGNVTRWSAVTSPDATPPGPVTGVRVTPTYRTATVELTLPDDPDLVGYTYGVAEGDAVPERQPYSPQRAGSFAVGPLRMDTTYTVGVWTEDDLGNRGEPVLTRFRTPLDSTPPGGATGLTATGGDYALTASWRPPADTDLETVRVTLVDLTTGAETAGPTSRTATTHTWTRLPGGRDYEVRVTATDLNGLVGPTATARGRTADDANGPPPPINPATVTATPRSSTKVSISFPKPVLPDLKSLGYALIPVGADPESVTSVTPFVVPGTSAVTADLTPAEPLVPMQLVLYAWDHNGNRARSVVPSIVGVVTAADLPYAPSVRATAGLSNELAVTWAPNPFSPRVTEWVLTATSGTERRTVTVTADVLRYGFTDLPGRRDWVVTVAGRGTHGTGPANAAPAVTVADVLPPAPASGLVLTPSYDTQLLSWTNPSTHDFSYVVVTRYGATAAETLELYRGTGTSVRAAGLVGGRSYTYVVATYDAFGQTAVEPTRIVAEQSSITVAAASVRYPDSVSLRGSATWQGGLLSQRGLVVEAQTVGSTTWRRVATVTTSATGTYAVSLRPTVSTRYRVGYVGSGSRTGTWSPVRTISVAPSVSVRASRTTVPRNGSVTLSTVVGPRHAGSVVTLQRWTGRVWATVTTRRLTSTSAASATVRPPGPGTSSYRWVLAAHTDHVAGTSATMRVRVR